MFFFVSLRPSFFLVLFLFTKTLLNCFLIDEIYSQVIPQVCRDCDIIPVMYEETQGVPPAKEEGIIFPPRQLEKRDVEMEMEADLEMDMNHDPNGKCHVRKELPKCQKKIKKGYVLSSHFLLLIKYYRSGGI